jgi:hypothetical protein
MDRKYNFLSMLNLPETVQHFGSPRHYFEGKYLGERFVQDIKNMRPCCPPKQVLLNLLFKLHGTKSIQAMAKLQSKKVQTMKPNKAGSQRDPQRREILGNAKVYTSLKLAQSSFYSKGTLSMIKTKEQGFGIMYYQGSTQGSIWVCKMERFDMEHTELHGIRYWKWAVSDSEKLLSKLTITNFVVFLPKADVLGQTVQLEFTMVTKEWLLAMLDHYKLSELGMDVKTRMWVKSS